MICQSYFRVARLRLLIFLSSIAFKVKPLVPVCVTENARAKGNLQRYYVGMVALLTYDYCLTIGQELEEIWTGNRSVSASFINISLPSFR